MEDNMIREVIIPMVTGIGRYILVLFAIFAVIYMIMEYANKSDSDFLREIMGGGDFCTQNEIEVCFINKKHWIVLTPDYPTLEWMADNNKMYKYISPKLCDDGSFTMVVIDGNTWRYCYRK